MHSSMKRIIQRLCLSQIIHSCKLHPCWRKFKLGNDIPFHPYHHIPIIQFPSPLDIPVRDASAGAVPASVP